MKMSLKYTCYISVEVSIFLLNEENLLISNIGVGAIPVFTKEELLTYWKCKFTGLIDDNWGVKNLKLSVIMIISEVHCAC